LTITDYHGTKIQLEFILFETNLHIFLYFAWLAILTVSKIACYHVTKKDIAKEFASVEKSLKFQVVHLKMLAG